MARIAGVLAVIGRSAWRNLRSVGGFAGNNLVAVIVLLMAEEPLDRPSSTAAFYFLIGLLYTIPLANDLTLRIPPERFGLWPLSRIERGLIHAVNVALNPMLFIAVLFASLSRHPAVGAGLLAAGVAGPFAAYAIRFAGHVARGAERFSVFRVIPRFPGRFGGLVQNRLRGLLRMFDVYFAAALSFGGVCYRVFASNPDPMATVVIGHLVLIAISTLAQAHLAFDAESEEARMRLLPASRAAVVLAKDVAWLSIAAVLTVCYASLPIAAAAITALTAGHYTVGREPIEQRRGHFASGTLGPVGIAQIVAIVVAGIATLRFGIAAFALFAGAYGVSVLMAGRRPLADARGSEQ